MTRLSDEELAYMQCIAVKEEVDTDDLLELARLAQRATAELRERRAEDLTAEDREALTFAKERVSFNLNASAASEYFSDAYADRHRHAIAVLSKLLDGGREGK